MSDFSDKMRKMDKYLSKKMYDVARQESRNRAHSEEKREQFREKANEMKERLDRLERLERPDWY